MKWKMVNLDDGRHEFPEYENPLVLVCEDVGKIVSATVNNWTDNFPYFRLNIITDSGYFECGHKYSYMGVIHGICGEVLYNDLIYKFLPEKIPNFEFGEEKTTLERKSALQRCKKDKDGLVNEEWPRRDRVYFTDPRLQYLAYAGIVGRASSLYGTSREHHFAPRMKTKEESVEWLRRFGLYGEFCVKEENEHFYDKLMAMYEYLRKHHCGRQLI